VKQLSICVAVDLEGETAVEYVAAGFEVIRKGGRFYGGARGLEIVLRTTGQESEAVPSQLTLLTKLKSRNRFRRHAESRYFERFRFGIEYA
jgi:hypothetical protein